MANIPRTISLHLIGSVLINDDDADYRWFGNTFNRITSEVETAGAVGRVMRFDGDLGEGRPVRFFGIEVERNAEIPAGLVAWELREDAWTLWEPAGGGSTVTWQGALRWQWRERAADGRWCGDFTALCPPAWGGDARQVEFRVSGHAYLGKSDDEIHLTEYDPSWPAQYAEFAAWLRGCLGLDIALRIEHYGSTAIPGMPAKPVIDVLVEVPSFAAARQRALPLLHGEAWEYWCYHEHMVFIKRDAQTGRRTHHVHMAPREHPVWRGLTFRDYLRTHPEAAARYAALKTELVARHCDDREAYTTAKVDFVNEITEAAIPDKSIS